MPNELMQDMAQDAQNSLSLNEIEIDAIGEVMNISMGSAATAVSAMLDKQVVITTPKVTVESLAEIDYANLEPALVVKITYTQGITGSNVMVFSQRDMQMILNQLMGIDEPVNDGDFVFDELSMSAACEVMNQMMGASATALSDFLGKSINISTPTATMMDSYDTFADAVGVSSTDNIVSIVFNLKIDGIMDTEFVSVMTRELAKAIVSQFLGEPEKPQPVAAPTPAPAPAAAPPAPAPAGFAPAAVPPAMPAGMMPQMPLDAAGAFAPPMPQMPPYAAAPGMAPNPYYPPYGAGYPPYGYPTPPYYNGAPAGAQAAAPEQHKVHRAQFPEFAAGGAPVGEGPLLAGNMELIMNVPLSVSVEIGKTKKKIKDIMDFNQGTVIELEKQAGAPVDIVVNGQLFARGDVVVIDDNFGVRITEIIGTKELLSALEHK